MGAERRAGFTLIEVLVALTLGAAVVLLVRAAFGACSEFSARLEAEATAHRHGMSAHRRLALVFGSIDIATAHSTGFHGDPGRAAFQTSVAQESGRASAAAVLDAKGGRLLLRLGQQAPESLLAAEGVEIDYLMSTGADSRWLSAWHSPASAPLAVRIRTVSRGASRTDTLLFLIGPRG